jgi:hypothetical protein
MGNLFAARTAGAVVDEATHHIDGHPTFTDWAAPPLPFGPVAEEVLVAHQTGSVGVDLAVF